MFISVFYFSLSAGQKAAESPKVYEWFQTRSLWAVHPSMSPECNIFITKSYVICIYSLFWPWLVRSGTYYLFARNRSLCHSDPCVISCDSTNYSLSEWWKNFLGIFLIEFEICCLTDNFDTDGNSVDAFLPRIKLKNLLIKCKFDSSLFERILFVIVACW